MAATELPSSSETTSLKGKMLLAMPGMGDARFERAVLVILEHNDQGAMGLIVNKPLAGIEFDDLLEQLDITATMPVELPVMYGGPVEIGRGFILHSPDVVLPQSAMLSDNVGLSTMLDVLNQIATGEGPKELLFCLGYAGWTAGQLDEEIKQNAWLHAPLSPEILFHLPHEKRWDAAMALLGINPDFLASNAGHA
jgi:putative transcriptional regulator